jgi:hypothetical protein
MACPAWRRSSVLLRLCPALSTCRRRREQLAGLCWLAYPYSRGTAVYYILDSGFRIPPTIDTFVEHIYGTSRHAAAGITRRASVSPIGALRQRACILSDLQTSRGIGGCVGGRNSNRRHWTSPNFGIQMLEVSSEWPRREVYCVLQVQDCWPCCLHHLLALVIQHLISHLCHTTVPLLAPARFCHVDQERLLEHSRP